jgi:hypothetical protein
MLWVKLFMSFRIERATNFILFLVVCFFCNEASGQVTPRGGKYPFQESFFIKGKDVWPEFRQSIDEIATKLEKEGTSGKDKGTTSPPSIVFKQGCENGEEGCPDIYSSASLSNDLNLKSLMVADPIMHSNAAANNEVRIQEAANTFRTYQFASSSTAQLTNPAINRAFVDTNNLLSLQFQNEAIAQESNQRVLNDKPGAIGGISDCIKKYLTANPNSDAAYAASICRSEFNPAKQNVTAILSAEKGVNPPRVDNSDKADEVRLSDLIYNDGFDCQNRATQQEKSKCETSRSNRSWFRLLFGDVVFQKIPNPATDKYGQFDFKFTKVAPYPNCNLGIDNITPSQAEELREFGCGGIPLAIHFLAAETVRMLFTYTKYHCQELATFGNESDENFPVFANREKNHPRYSLVENGGFCDNPDPDLTHMKAFLSLQDLTFPCKAMYWPFEVSRRIKYDTRFVTSEQCEAELEPDENRYADFNAYKENYVKQVPEYKRMYVFYATIKAAIHVLEIVKSTRASLTAQQGALNPEYLRQANELVDSSLPESFYESLQESEREFVKMIATINDDRIRAQSNQGSGIALGVLASQKQQSGIND